MYELNFTTGHETLSWSIIYEIMRIEFGKLKRSFAKNSTIYGKIITYMIKEVKNIRSLKLKISTKS